MPYLWCPEHHMHGQFIARGGSLMPGISTPGVPYNPVVHGYVPGSSPAASSYDVPQGSQAIKSQDDEVPPAVPNHTIFVDDYDPDYAFSTSPLNPGEPTSTPLEGSGLDDDDQFVILPT